MESNLRPAENDATLTEFQQLNELISGFWATQVLNVAVQLGIPEQLSGGPKTSASIAQSANAHPPSVFRLLRALQTLGICRAVEAERFELTSLGHLLRPDIPDSLHGRALFSGDMLWQQYGDLAYVVKSGHSTRVIDTGPDAFKRLSSDPVRVDAFQRAMAEGSVRTGRDAIAGYEFSRFASLLDLGGGYGGLLSVLLNACPRMIGAVCDLAYLEPAALRYLQETGVGSRANFVVGDFFDSVPGDYEAYILKSIVHDWDDECALKILRNIHRAATANATLLLLERLIPEQVSTAVADRAVIRSDITMMTIGSQERTVAEYRQLLSLAGWTVTRVVHISPDFSLLEATRV